MNIALNITKVAIMEENWENLASDRDGTVIVGRDFRVFVGLTQN